MLLIILTVKVHAAAPDKHSVDSLNHVLATSIPDSVRADTYFQLATQYRDNHPDKALEYAGTVLALSERIGYTRGVADAYRIFGGVYFDKKDVAQSIKYKKNELKLRRELLDSQRVAVLLYTLGDTYSTMSDIDESLRYYSEALELNQRLGNKEDVAGLYHNIAAIYERLGNVAEAFELVQKAVKLNEEVGNREWKGINFISIGRYYYKKGQIDKAVEYNESALEIFRTIGNKKGMARCLGNIGYFSAINGDYAKADSYLRDAIGRCRELNDTIMVSHELLNFGYSAMWQKKLQQAALYLDSSLNLFNATGGNPGNLERLYKAKYELDSISGNMDGAFKNYKLYIAMRDSVIMGESYTKARYQKIRIEFAKKEAEAQAEQEKKDIQQATIRNSMVGGLVGTLAFLLVVYRQRNRIKSANTKNEELLLNILPTEVADELKSTGTASAKHFDNVTVLFTDFKNFTTVSEELSPQELVDELHACFKGFDEIMSKYSIEKIKTIGDAYLAVSGLPQADENHAVNVVNAALEIREFMKQRRENLGEKTFEIRIGINSGSVVAGIVGVKKFAYDIWGDTVNTAARMEQNSEPGKINISETTHALVKDKFACEFRGEIDAKNKGKLAMYFVEKSRRDS